MMNANVFSPIYCTGIEDKIISTKGYCLVLTDEGFGFFEDLKRKDSKHEGNLII